MPWFHQIRLLRSARERNLWTPLVTKNKASTAGGRCSAKPRENFRCWSSSCVTPAYTPTYTEKCQPAFRIEGMTLRRHTHLSRSFLWQFPDVYVGGTVIDGIEPPSGTEEDTISRNLFLHFSTCKGERTTSPSPNLASFGESGAPKANMGTKYSV